MLSALKSLFAGGGARSENAKLADLEARLVAPAGSRGHGEIDYSERADGSRSLEVELRDVSPGEAEIVIDGRIAARVPIRGVKADHYLSTRAGDAPPLCRIGDRVEVRLNGAVVLKGEFQQD
jgi:hypothetical protein